MGGTGELVQIAVLDHAIAHAVGHAPLQQRLQARDARLQQVQLAQRLRPRVERGQHGVQAVQAQLVAAAAPTTARSRHLRARQRRHQGRTPDPGPASSVVRSHAAPASPASG
ncbi:hypothetical protein G6F63_014739 [Rhizopus arrhizus]|nr:hypothetical protein G6F63_014739 [Rhizopus arrhizus]